MDNLANMILKGESASQISDAIKNELFLKSRNRIDEFEPVVASNLFVPEEDAE